MVMDHLSLACSLSHILYCHVLSLCHLCTHSSGSGWEWTISRSSVVCHIDCTVLCCHCVINVLSLCRQWMGMDHLSLTYSLSHRYYIVLLRVAIISSIGLSTLHAVDGNGSYLSHLQFVTCIVSSSFVVSCMVLLSSAFSDIRQLIAASCIGSL